MMPYDYKYSSKTCFHPKFAWSLLYCKNIEAMHILKVLQKFIWWALISIYSRAGYSEYNLRKRVSVCTHMTIFRKPYIHINIQQCVRSILHRTRVFKIISSSYVDWVIYIPTQQTQLSLLCQWELSCVSL